MLRFLCILVMSLVVLEAMKLPSSTEITLEELLEELQHRPGKRVRLQQLQQHPTPDSLLDYPLLYHLLSPEKRRLMPYSGGIFGR